MEALPENDLESFMQQGIDQDAKNKILFDKNNHLLHRVFVQSEIGAELLAKWRDSLMMVPTLASDSTQFDAGMNEGEKRFIRNLIVSIQSVEQDNE
jgi:hypothetical protein